MNHSTNTHEREGDFMSTQTQQRYVVHLDIQATAIDSVDAVEEALRRVRLGGLADLVYSVERVAADAETLALSTPDPGADGISHHRQDDDFHEDYRTYRGEFLG